MTGEKKITQRSYVLQREEREKKLWWQTAALVNVDFVKYKYEHCQLTIRFYESNRHMNAASSAALHAFVSQILNVHYY